MHVHSKYSKDAITKPRTLVKRAAKLGIGIALTDHNTTKGWAETEKLAKKEGVPFIRGEEIKVFDNETFIGELMGFFMQAHVKMGSHGEVTDALHSQDALVSIPHPFDKLRVPRIFAHECAGGLDLVEVFNPRTHFEKYNKQAQRFAQRRNLPGIAGSDSHTPEELGNAYTEVEAETVEEARRAILKGRCTWNGRYAGRWVHVQTWLAKRGLLGER